MAATTHRTLLLVLGIASIAAAAAATAPSASAQANSRSPVRASRISRPIVPVLAESGGAVLRERQGRAKVRIYAVGEPGGRRLVGRGRTGTRGVALVPLRGRKAPRQLLVVVDGGRLLGRRFGGHMKARTAYRGFHAVFVSPLSSMVVQYIGEHHGASLRKARRAIRRSFGIPGFFDFAGDLADRRLFDGRAFIRRARGHGGFDRYLRRRTRRLTQTRAHSSALVSESCWHEAAQTTAGFAELMGFSGVPSPPALPACRLGGTADASVATAHASSIPGLEVFGVLTSLASAIYGVASGTGTSAQLSAIQDQLDEVQSELQDIQAELGSLQIEVDELMAGQSQTEESTLADSASKTIGKIKRDGDDTMALVGAIDQILCKPGKGCSEPEGAANLGQAVQMACEPSSTETYPHKRSCETYASVLDETIRALEKAEPLIAVEALGVTAEGSAVSGVNDPGIVQYALALSTEQFFTTGDAADARLQWAYYTLYSAYAQTDLAAVLCLGLGQPQPHSPDAESPPTITTATVRRQVDKLNKPISLQMSAFPNMPDTAVIDTNVGTPEPPYMFAQQIGALASVAAYSLNAEYELNKADVSSGSIHASTGTAYLTTLETSGEPPLVMTPAAASGETWELLPVRGKRSHPPAISTATFSDWNTAGANDPGTTLPEWNSTKQTVEREGTPGLTGSLPSLYNTAELAAGESAGQWMTSHSGIEQQLLTPNATSYSSQLLSGIVPYYKESEDDSRKDPGLGFLPCIPAGDNRCLLPTWQSVSVNPYDQVTPGQTYNSGSGQINTGLFDLNSGLVIANQQGHGADTADDFYELESNPSAFLNQYPNWTNLAELRGNSTFYGFLSSLESGSPWLQPASYNTKGRPVLFSRQQGADECFYWTDGGTSGASYGSGCLKQRPHSGEILP